MRDYADNRMAGEGRRPARKPEMARWRELHYLSLRPLVLLRVQQAQHPPTQRRWRDARRVPKNGDRRAGFVNRKRRPVLRSRSSNAMWRFLRAYAVFCRVTACDQLSAERVPVPAA